MAGLCAKEPLVRQRHLCLDDDDYPSRIKKLLGKKAPNNLHVMGNIALLDEKGVGFCGSRKTTNKGLETAEDCAKQMAENHVVVISGNAAGVDFTVHYHALAAGGKTILVLPEGINHFRIKRALKPVWDWKRVLVLSHCEPKTRWQVFHAMDRNKIIMALSRAMIVIEAGERGGTMAAGKETLGMKMPLYVAVYEDMVANAQGNQILLNMGAQKLRRANHTKVANLKHVLRDVNQDSLLERTLMQASLL